MKTHSTRRWRDILTFGAAAASVALLVAPPSARACGGFFCNRQAIDQSGENILFSYNEDGSITTVVQIFYQGPSEEFAWILPVPAEPQVDVGTDALFAQLAQSTTPRFRMRAETVGTCRSEPRCFDDPLTAEGSERNEPGAFADAGAAAPENDGVDVRLRANVGPYDVAVLAAGDADALRTWLTDNGYLIPEEAAAELDHYVELDHFFVALRLQKHRSAGEIQPIVLRSDSPEPCIPIRLTRIATIPDMPITAYFLAPRRARPMNYMLVQPDLEDVGLWTGETSYSEAVTRAVDDAGGHAFVTDYAGDVPSVSLELGDIEDLRTIEDPSRFLQELQGRGFSGDSQLLGILTRQLPPPVDWDPQTFYNCLTRGWCLDDPEVEAHLEAIAFDPAATVDALTEAIVRPRAEAQALMESHDHLTRLFTTMSAEEMTQDPMFMLSEELPRDHPNVHEATRRTECGSEYFHWTAPQTLILPSGATHQLREGVPYYGSDDEYCEDRYDGDFRPGAPMERLREVSAARGTSPGGGGVSCAVSPSTGGLGGAVVVALGLLGWVWRRRRG